jgi:Uma2 family endonuclease
MSLLDRRPRPAIVYPESDGNPIAENTLQFEWIVKIKEGLERMLSKRPDAFVAGDLLWYPVEGHPEICTAPDALVALGRPKGFRGSYKQFEENGIAPQVVFEVLSPGNRSKAMTEKRKFYEKYGVDEYYIYDPDDIELTGYLRSEGELRNIADMNGWISPLLGIRFDRSGSVLVIYGPDGQRFLSYQEMAQERDRVTQERDRVTQERDRVTQERDRVTQERNEVSLELDRIEFERAKLAQERDLERQRVERMAAQLRALGVEPPT